MQKHSESKFIGKVKRKRKKSLHCRQTRHCTFYTHKPSISCYYIHNKLVSVYQYSQVIKTNGKFSQNTLFLCIWVKKNYHALKIHAHRTHSSRYMWVHCALITMLQRETKEKSFQFYGLFRWDLSTNRSRLIFIRFRYSNVWIIEVKWARSREQNVNSICVCVTFLPNDRYRHISPSASLSHTAPHVCALKQTNSEFFTNIVVVDCSDPFFPISTPTKHTHSWSYHKYFMSIYFYLWIYMYISTNVSECVCVCVRLSFSVELTAILQKKWFTALVDRIASVRARV